MELEQSLQPQAQMNIAITANLITSLKILQLSSEELEQTIEQELVDNPALEMEERETCPVCGGGMPDGYCPECAASPKSPELSEESQWEDDTYDSWRIDVRPNAAGDDDYDPVALAASETSMADYLSDVLHSSIPAEDGAIADYLIGSLDESGYLTVSDQEVADACGVSLDRVRDVVSVLQQQDPPGVGARSPRECLIVQLRHLMEDGKGDALALRILNECFEELGQHRFELIASRLRVKVDHVLTSWAFIKDNLTPFPAWSTWQNGQRSAGSNSGFVRPDVAIKPSEDGYVVDVLEESRYQFRINDFYKQLLGVVIGAAAQRGGQDVDGLAILGHRPPGDEHGLVAQFGGDLFVAQRSLGVLAANDLADSVLGGQRSVEYVIEADHALAGQEHVLVGRGTADGRLVQSHVIGHFGACQRLEVADAVIQEVALHLDDAFGDQADGVPTFLDEADEELGLVGMLAHEVAFFGR